jgi:alkylation response protein AidB-like acyl-CoA dehydrogenase
VTALERRLPLRLTSDEEQLKKIVREFVGAVLPAPTGDKPSWAEVDPDGRLWRRIATELGLQSLGMPEEFGGQGFGVAALAIVFHELGRTVCAAPLFGTVALAGQLLAALPAGAERDRLLAGIADGSVRATACYGGDFTSEAGRLTGRATAVVDAPVADVLLVVLGDDVYAIDAQAIGVSVRAMDGMDLTRALGELHLDAAPATLLAAHAADPIARARAAATALLAAELTGVAEAALDEAVQYSTIRTQFGRPIGSFQSLKHRMADMLVANEGAWSLGRHAALLSDALDPVPSVRELELAASAAVAAASSAATFATAENIQIHGGIGFTWQHKAHLRFRRARSASLLLGSPNVHRARVAEILHAEGGRRGPA